MGEADVLMPEKVVESLLGENGDLIQVDQMIVVVMVILNVLMLPTVGMVLLEILVTMLMLLLMLMPGRWSRA